VASISSDTWTLNLIVVFFMRFSQLLIVPVHPLQVQPMQRIQIQSIAPEGGIPPGCRVRRHKQWEEE